uniref:Uncharacterized protein LOC111107887 n=1 Tax=Crassostrea virginica TaxID=6565 RepID=A0A8B8B6G0_CRAVI|nr:uncharacterized protein LOC111107887 [Crassostrea virginica]
MADTIDFYLVEEGIKRNKHSVSLLEDVGLMIWNRAHAELSYLQEIDKWKDKVMAEDTDGDNRGVLDFVKPALIGEADRAAEIHKSIYDKLMARKGPYQNILKHNKQDQEKNKKSKLKEIEEEFNNCNARRKELEYQVQKQKQSVEKTALQLSEFEQKLSRRSRITDGRRSARGMRKLDSINAQVSLFRKRIETTSASCSRDEAELQSLIICKSKMLKKMFQDLKDMDEQRLAAIHGVIRQYVQEIQPPYDLIRERFITWRISISSIYFSNCFEHTQLHKSGEISEATKSLQSLNIREIHNQNWQLTEDRARLKKAGLKMGFDVGQ